MDVRYGRQKLGIVVSCLGLVILATLLWVWLPGDDGTTVTANGAGIGLGAAAIGFFGIALFSQLFWWASTGSVAAGNEAMRAADERVRAQMVAVIYAQAPPALAMSVAVAGLLLVILWNVTSPSVLVAWITAIAGIAALRLVLLLRYRRRDPESSDVSWWETWFVVTLALTGLAWGGGGVLIMPPDSLAHQAVVYFFLMGMAGAAVAHYSGHAACTSVMIISVMFPATAWFLVQDDMPRRAMALGGLIYVSSAYRATQGLAYFLRRSFLLSDELAEARREVAAASRRDDLTGLSNRHAFHEDAERLVEIAARYRDPLALLVVDVDHFRRINEEHGYPAGDSIVTAIAGLVKESVRASDVAGRIGADRFAVLLTRTSYEGAINWAERLRKSVVDLGVGRPMGVASSIGVAAPGARVTLLDDLIARADLALREAKAAGGNRVVGRG